MDTSSMDQSRLAKYQLVIRKKSAQAIASSELDLLTFDDHKTDSFLNGYRQIKVNELLKHVGDDERYQKLILMFLCMFNFFYSFIAFMIPYVFYEPVYYCNQFDGSKKTCPMEEACNNKYGFSTFTAIRSLIVENKLYCDRRKYLYISEASFVVTGGFIAFLFAFLSDKVGRRPIFILSFCLTMIGTFTCLLSTNLTVIVIGNMFSWSGMDTFFSMIFVYCNEMIGSALRSKSNAVLFFCWGLGQVVFNILNIWISDYRTIFFIQFLPLFVAGIGYFYLKETPYWLYKKKKISELFFTLKYVGLMNGRKELELEDRLTSDLGLDQLVTRRLENSDKIELIPLIVTGEAPFSNYLRGCGKLCKDRATLLKLIGVTMITANIYIGYSLSILIPQKIGLADIHLNGVFLGISEILGYIFVILFGNLIPRRILNFSCALIVILLDVVLLIFDSTSNRWNNSTLRWSQTIVSCLIKLVLCINYALIFNYCSELFPTKIRGMALGVCVFFGRFMIIFSFLLQNLTDYFEINPMIGTVFGSLLVLPITLCLPETLNQAISN